MMKQIIATNKAPGAIGPYSQGTSCDQLVFTSGQLVKCTLSGAFLSTLRTRF